MWKSNRLNNVFVNFVLVFCSFFAKKQRFGRVFVDLPLFFVTQYLVAVFKIFTQDIVAQHLTLSSVSIILVFAAPKIRQWRRQVIF